jgi:tetrahydromethanopterin S-methyltransferase subunit G|tara:strand:+ start:1855 stop:2139 length:285 start_codon:yes stop_codon:yes gene_type:complete
MAESGTQTQRLDRIEEKIDRLSEAMISLARAEEKLIAIEKNNHNNFDRMNKFSAKLDDIEKKVDDNARTVAIINKVVYAISVAVIAGIVKYFWM